MNLLADDSSLMRNWLKQMLQNHGYRHVSETSKGGEAFHLIMEINPKAKGIMCSVLPNNENTIAALMPGAMCFLPKPFLIDMKRLLERTQETQGGRPYEACFF